jgi:ADP-heptose:LPS heptosyltransferase
MMEVGSWDLIINQDRNEDDEYSFFQVYEKGEGSDVFSFSYKDPRPDKTAAVVRYGAFGDMFQCAPVLAALREEGYHTTLITCPRGYQAVSNDPNIDRVILHDTGQIPIHELHHFLGKWSKMYDRFVHLSESVEGSLLVMPGRVIRTWPTKARDLLLNVNYGEITAAIAEIDYKKWHKHQKFYETTEEREWVEKLVQSAEGSPIVTFCLSGSSVHKAWPYLDNIIAKLLLDTNALIILTGDSWCQILEQGWTEEPRVMCKSNKWSIRQSLVTAKYSDMVIGPETGVMNAVSYEKMPKILLLSHSSVENLPRDWTNTYALFSPDTPCYPCHMMHYDWSSCRREENTGAAFCQASILPGQMWEAIEHAIRKNPKWKTPKLVNQNGERLSVQSA